MDREIRVSTDKRAGRSRMVEVDMRENQVAEILDGEPLLGEARLERCETGRRAAVDERGLLALEQVRRDDPGAPEMLQVEQLRRGRAT
jgi:hypothetical protein